MKAFRKLLLLRGGSWHNYPRNCRSASRYLYEPGYAINNVGFRVVCLNQSSNSNAK